MAESTRDKGQAPAVIERFVRQLVVTFKAVSLYPPSSTIPRDNAEAAVEALSAALEELPDIRLVVSKAGLAFEDVPLFPGQSAFAAFAAEFYARNVAEVRFHSGTSSADLLAFLTLLTIDPVELSATGGFESRLWDQGVDNITLSESQVSLIDKPAGVSDTPRAEGARQLTIEDIDELVASALAGSARDRGVVVALISEPKLLKSYLTTPKRGQDRIDPSTMGGRLADLSRVAMESPPEDAPGQFQALAAAVADLDVDSKRSLLIDRLLPEARADDAVASLVRHMDIDEVCRALVEGEDEKGIKGQGLARAIRNLAMIAAVEREDVVFAAGAAMRAAGYDDERVESVLDAALPSHIHVREVPKPEQGYTSAQPAETILKLLDVAATSGHLADESDPDVRAVMDEARRGVTDADVLAALVALVSLDPREESFSGTMTMLEDAIELLVARGEIDTAADIALALRAASEDTRLSRDQRDRIIAAMDKFARPKDVRELVSAMRVYDAGQPEHEAAKRLLDTLGDRAIAPLLEVLADEPDMTARKGIIDLLAGMAADHIAELGARLSDQRWYFVRNIVLILGSTHRPAILPYLERTIRHPEARVRRETIRALAGVSDRMSVEMLVAALADDDAQNVQLAARYLGTAGVSTAVPVLEQVAKGEGRGNRDMGPRVEAVEALGRIGDEHALATLKSLVGRRSLLGSGKQRELKAAAEEAIARISRGGGG